jgi:RimJ/RimL family protein N-acetyltransferase
MDDGGPTPIRTPRLRLVAATAGLARADADESERLAEILGARVPETWPPPLLDDARGRFAEMMEANPELAGWYLWYWIRVDPEGGDALIGAGGFKGRPTPDGTVEVGYSLVESAWHQGYATEAVAALIDRAFEHPSILRVVAETYPDLAPSIRVLTRLGFRFLGTGSEDGTVRYVLVRSDER